MNDALCQTVKTRYVDYAEASFTGGDADFFLKLKLEHSRYVAEDCRAVAAELGWDAGQVNLAEIVGLLHDVGRYSQFTEFKTFLDRESVNHGLRGAQVLEDTDMLTGCAAEVQAIVVTATRYHNVRDIPSDVTPAQLPCLQLVRDADKVDIYRVFRESFRHNWLEKYPEVLLGVDPEGPLSEDLIREIQKTRRGSYQYVKSLADINLMRVVWVYDMTYPPMLRRVAERGLLDDLRETIPDHPAIHGIMADAFAHLDAHGQPGHTLRR